MADVKHDIGFDAAGRVIAIGEDSRAEETRILEHPDATPVLIVAQLGDDLAVRVFGPPSLKLAEVLDTVARDYRRAVEVSLAARS
jgi:hypothetical protein